METQAPAAGSAIALRVALRPIWRSDVPLLTIRGLASIPRSRVAKRPLGGRLVITWSVLGLLTVTPASAQSPAVPRPGDIHASTIPPVFREELALVRRARASLDAPRKWNHRDRGTCSGPLRVSIHCALEQAAQEERVHPAVLDAVLQEARLAIWDVVVSRELEHPLMDYNNDPATGFADVQRLLRWLETRITRRLAQGRATVTARQDDPEANPPAAPVDLLIISQANELLRSRTAWNSHDTRDCPAGATSFSLYCALVEGSDRVLHDLEPRGAVMQEARFVVAELAKDRRYEHRLMDYNNDPTTGFAGVQKALRLVQSRLEQRLASGK